MARLTPVEGRALAAHVGASRARLAPAVEVPELFTADECARIVRLRDALGHAPAAVTARDDYQRGGPELQVSKGVRQTERTDLAPGPAHQWIYDRVADGVSRANAQAWQFKLAFIEPIQLLRYPVGGHYSWHADLGATGAASLRKVSATILLSAPDSHDGGALELMNGSRTLVPTPTQGRAIVFPAYQVHRVTPVTRGERYALVVWTLGSKPLR